MIGQIKLQEKLKRFTLSNFPKTILFVGDKGCGKHTLAKEMGEYFNVSVEDISELLNGEYINDIYLNTLCTIYLIDMSKITERSQNMMLKILEEPPTTACFILISSSKSSIINTVLNRCMIYEFEPYTKDELSYFVKSDDKDKILEYCTTPGQIINLNYKIIGEMEDTINKLIDKIDVVGYINLLTIANKFNYSDEYDKYDIDLFMDMLISKIEHLFYENTYKYAMQMYNISLKYKNLLKDDRYRKNLLIESMLTEMWNSIKEIKNG